MQEKSHTTLFRAAGKLLCNSVVNFNVGINRDDLSDKHWIYFPEKQYPFYRIGFPHNFSHELVPAGCSSLYGEFSYLQKSKADVSAQLAIALKQTKELLNIKPTDIETEIIIHIARAYVIFDRWRDRNINTIHAQLGSYNIHSVGRYGAWKYASMQEGLLDGKKVAEQILTTAQVPLSAVQVKHMVKHT